MCKTDNTITIYIPKCPRCGKEKHQKSRIIMYDAEARHSVVCMICRKEYKIEYDNLNKETLGFLEGFRDSQYQEDKED